MATCNCGTNTEVPAVPNSSTSTQKQRQPPTGIRCDAHKGGLLNANPAIPSLNSKPGCTQCEFPRKVLRGHRGPRSAVYLIKRTRNRGRLTKLHRGVWRSDLHDTPPRLIAKTAPHWHTHTHDSRRRGKSKILTSRSWDCTSLTYPHVHKWNNAEVQNSSCKSKLTLILKCQDHFDNCNAALRKLQFRVSYFALCSLPLLWNSKRTVRMLFQELDHVFRVWFHLIPSKRHRVVFLICINPVQEGYTGQRKLYSNIIRACIDLEHLHTRDQNSAKDQTLAGNRATLWQANGSARSTKLLNICSTRGA